MKLNTQEIAIADLEQIYDSLATGIDKAGQEKRTLYLVKLALILSARLNDKDVVLQAMKDALTDL